MRTHDYLHPERDHYPRAVGVVPALLRVGVVARAQLQASREVLVPGRMRLIAYLRVSGQGQVKDGFGLPTQERLIKDWVQRNDHRLVRTVSENGKSGAKDETDRPGLLDVLSAVEKGEAEGIVVSSLDRLARALTVQEAVLAKVWQAGGKVFTVDGGEVLADDPDDPMRTALRQITGVFAELDRRMTVKRLRNGRATKKAKGEGRAVGRHAYGEKPGEKEIVDRVCRLHEDGASLRAIIEALEAEGFLPRTGERFHPSTIARILARSK